MIHRRKPTRRSGRSTRGQSLVEFALVLPLLLILLLGIADFGRVFAAGITVEAATRNAAEAGAIERLRNKPTTPGDTTYYQSLHELAARVACSEARLLPNSTYVSSNQTCPTMPAIRACVKDGMDPMCGAPIAGYANDPLPPGCSALATGWSADSGGADGSHSVEVRICYRFTTLFNLHLALPMQAGINVGEVWIVKSRTFVIDCPPGDVSAC